MTTGGGSGELSVIWNANPEADIALYDIFWSELPGGSYSYVTSVAPATGWPGGGRVGFVDWPRSVEVGKDCYVVIAVDWAENAAPVSAEACFTP